MVNNKFIQAALILSIMFSFMTQSSFRSQVGTDKEIQKITLYNRHNSNDKDFGKSSFNFQYGVRSDVGKEIAKNNWDIRYGYITINDSSDYFGVTLISNDRSRIKDLGKKNWIDMKQVPVLSANPGPYKGIRFPINGEPLDANIEATSEGQITKVVEGHMYVAHIKDDYTDLYVLLRVEELMSNDRCTISWRIVPSPEEKQ